MAVYRTEGSPRMFCECLKVKTNVNVSAEQKD